MILNWRTNPEANGDLTKADYVSLRYYFWIAIYKRVVGKKYKLLLSCPELGLGSINLKTNDWQIAERRAIGIIVKKADQLYSQADQLRKKYIRS